MAEFKYYTRGNSSPQGKQRIYFTAYPDDYDRYFDIIRKDILNRQDVAIFYLDGGTTSDEVEDYELRLGEMQLFVVPVTTKLLTKTNRAMEVDVPFAFEHHIPVLPLMQESGLDDIFNKKFGDLQYLDKHNTDPTAIPYEKKLTKYLESVIVGDELAKKVRAAFDAYIFLSYRKKDRKYAQELMKLIHSNPICRDIAIWYDEFLTPGENFNESIRAALEKSELFALAVTPNLINEINYILTTEYPLACEMGKKILPAEMEATDRNKLGELYADLPELIANGDSSALAARLSDLLEAVAVRENDTDPQHNFFIGLAYLGGIDVEVNHERAVELITAAAEADYIPAIEKLVSMYQEGIGVKHNKEEAIRWSKQRVRVMESIARKTRRISDYRKLIDAYNIHGYVFLYYKMYSEAKENYYNGFKIAKAIADKNNTITARDDLRCSCALLSMVIRHACYNRLDPEAEAWIRYEIEIVNSIAEETGNHNWYNILAEDYQKLGLYIKDQKALEHAYSIWSQLADQCPDYPIYKDLKEDVLKDIIKLFG